MADKKSLQPSPSWLYRFLDWMRSTPLNGLVVAVAIFLIGAGLIHWPQWQTGRLPVFQFDTQLLFESTWLPGNLLVWIWLDLIAHNAIYNFAIGTGKTKQEAQAIYVAFISIHPTIAWVLLAVGLFLGLGNVVTQGEIPAGNLLFMLAAAGPVLGSVMELFSVFRLIRQLVQVDVLYKNVKSINLFNLWPIYSLSRYGYTLALVFILVTVLVDLVFRAVGGEGIAFAYIVYTVIVSLLVFLAPLFGINNRLRTEKAHELQRLGIQLNSIYNETETAVRSRKLTKVPELRNASSALKDQMETVLKVATWPWNPGSLRNLLLPILLPLFIAILQRYVLSFLGF